MAKLYVEQFTARDFDNRYVTSNGVRFNEDYSYHGAHFTLYKAQGVTDAMINEAKKELRRDRDVTGFSVYGVEIVEAYA